MYGVPKLTHDQNALFEASPTRLLYKVASMFVPQEWTAWWQVHAQGDRETMELYWLQHPGEHSSPAYATSLYLAQLPFVV
jgi:hypothetical protein